MGTTKLAVYSGTLRLLGDTKLASLSENREPRRILDDLWTEHTAMCLASGDWNFATRSVEIDYDPDVDLSHGYQYAFGIPDDWLRTSALSATDTFNPPLTDYAEEGGYWKADLTPLYVKYISGDSGYGMDLSIWTPAFSLYVQAHLAAEMAMHHRNASFDVMDKLRKKRRSEALGQDGRGQPPGFAPMGSWVRARLGSSTRNERTRADGSGAV